MWQYILTARRERPRWPIAASITEGPRWATQGHRVGHGEGPRWATQAHRGAVMGHRWAEARGWPGRWAFTVILFRWWAIHWKATVGEGPTSPSRLSPLAV